MKLEIKAAILTAAFILAVITAGSTIYFLPDVAAGIFITVVVCAMIYHLYNDILRDLRRIENNSTVDPKRDSM